MRVVMSAHTAAVRECVISSINLPEPPNDSQPSTPRFSGQKLAVSFGVRLKRMLSTSAPNAARSMCSGSLEIAQLDLALRNPRPKYPKPAIRPGTRRICQGQQSASSPGLERTSTEVGAIGSGSRRRQRGRASSSDLG